MNSWFDRTIADMPESRCYITTPIYYCNDKPHIGHIYSTTICDVYARFMRFAGRDVFFLTGTDEHGLKVEKSAAAHGMTPQAWADQNAGEFKQVMAAFGMTNDEFIRTTNPAHERQVQYFVQQLLESKAVYLGEFEGWYDEGQEEYYTETKAKELDYKSPVSKLPLSRAKEKNYYFRLSAYQNALEELFARQPDFVRPASRRNEVLGRLREGIQDVPISRTNFKWGIPMPNDPNHVIYVWIDALFNYITALGLGDPASEWHARRAKYWPATYHVIGKEILWFHAVIWPAVLMALNLPLPNCVYAHSFWISEGQKMSKSLGNFIDLQAINRYVSTYGQDAWRYYLISQGPLGSQDANFAASHFHEVFTKDLVNTVGNCPSRVTAMIGKYFGGQVPAPQGVDSGASHGFDWLSMCRQAVTRAESAMASLDEPAAIEAALALLRQVDSFINVTEPFKLAKDESKRAELAAILYKSLEGVRIASLLLWPVLPRKMEELWKALGLSIEPQQGKWHELTRWGGLKPNTMVQKVALFPRIEQACLLTH
jgi:methionyl-tRNA synthetase